MKFKHLRNISILLGVSFITFHHSPALGNQCTFNQEAGADVIVCSCWENEQKTVMRTAYTHVHSNILPEDACKVCDTELNLKGCHPKKN